MELTCRVCFQEQEVMVDIFEEVENFQSNLCLLLEKCGGLIVDQDDSYSHYLCKECTSDLLIAAKFRDKCERAKLILEERSNEYTLEAKEGSENFCDTGEKEDVNLLMLNNEGLSEFLVLAKEPNVNDEERIQLYEMSSDSVDESTMEYNKTVVSNEELIGEDDFTDGTSLNNEALEESSDLHTMAEDYPLSKTLSSSDSIEAGEVYDDLIEIVEENINNVKDSQPFNVLKSFSFPTEEESHFICDVCGAVFKLSGNLIKHLHSVHMIAQIYACEFCQSCFSNEENVAKHLESCSSNKEFKKPDKKISTMNSDNVCRYCGKKTVTLFALNMHERTHTGERPFSCTECNKAFKTNSALTSHAKRHSGVRDFICSICGKAFFESNHLKVHLATHTGSKPHTCPYCTKSFSRVFLLQNHIRTHTGERPYQCQYCDKAFMQLIDKKSHEIIHTGDKPHKCQVCSKGFVRRSLLRQHIIKHGHNQLDCLSANNNGIQEISQEYNLEVGFVEENFIVEEDTGD